MPTMIAPQKAGQKPVMWNGSAELAGDPAAQPQQQAVDDQADEAERQHVEQAADRLDDRLEYRVHDAEDQGDDDERPRLLGSRCCRQLDAGYQQVSDAERGGR